MSGASVVIPCHGRAAGLARIVAPLLADPATAEVIVVADRDEEALAAVAALGEPAVQAIAADAGNENGARQVGVEVAASEVVVLIDDDVLPLPGLISSHLRHAHERRVILGYMPVEPRLLHGIRRFPARVYEASYQDQVATWVERPDRILEKFWGGNFSARREDLLELGLVNPEYRGMYFADYDLGLRMSAAGLRGSFDRDAAARHLYERDSAGFVRDSRRQGAVQAERDEPIPPPSLADRLSSPILLAATYGAAGVGARRVERRLAHRLRRVEQRRGASAARGGRGEEMGLLIPRGEPGR